MMMRKGTLLLLILLLSVVRICVASDGEVKIGDRDDGSRTPAIHKIHLLDGDGHKIFPDDDPAMPFSVRQTCGECHDYALISRGWHFNASMDGSDDGRRGEPWLLVDRTAAMQVPVSYRNWPGAFKPDQLGLSGRRYTLAFGRHLAGGGISEVDGNASPEETVRGFVSGNLEVNCLACHDNAAGHDQSQFAAQVLKENFRWAAAATSDLAVVKGSAKSMPDTYDVYDMPPEDADLIPPSIAYSKGSFDADGKVFFDIEETPSSSRCYFCHSSVNSGSNPGNEADIHLSAGIGCSDCHRNQLDHLMTRGYERPGSDDPLTCKGCHIGSDVAEIPTRGLFGAPEPQHRGFPLAHFEKLTCTACHSGKWPGDVVGRTMTSRANGLGVPGFDRSPEALPHVFGPVFEKLDDGRIAPVNIIWPAYWAYVIGDEMAPIPLDRVRSVAGSVIAQGIGDAGNDWPKLTEGILARALKHLSSESGGKAVYIAGGKMHRLGPEGGIDSIEHEAAQAYSWPVAHAVRPAAQSLGVRGCQDCHSADSAFFFGAVAVDSPLVFQDRDTLAMAAFTELDDAYIGLSIGAFAFRPYWRALILLSVFVTSAVLLLYGLKALRRITEALGSDD